MPYREIHGNLFASNAEALVNTVNCVGPMGKGIALEFRRRYPDMFLAYKDVCGRRLLKPGMVLPYLKGRPWILNLAVKNDWKHPSKVEWVEECLQKFVDWYPTVGLTSVAFPWMGAMNGRIPLKLIQETMRFYLSDLSDIDVEVYSFDPDAPDPLFEKLLELRRTIEPDDFASRSNVSKSKAKMLYGVLDEVEVTSITHVVQSGLFGKTVLDRLYWFVAEQFSEAGEPIREQLELFSG